MRKFWTSDEDEIIREAWPRITSGQIETVSLLASLPGRTLAAIRNRGFSLGLTGRREKLVDEWEEILRRLHSEGLHDPEIAKHIGVSRRYCSELRDRLGLKSNAYNELHRRKVAECTRKQVANVGLNSLAEVRSKRFREFAESHGWPSDLRPRAVQILELLLANPAITRREICDGTGMPWKGSRKSLHSNDPEGSYLAHLMSRGLVMWSPRLFSGRTGKRKGSGCSDRAYMLTDLAQQMKATFLERNRDGKPNEIDELGGSECGNQQRQPARQPITASRAKPAHRRPARNGY